MSKIALNSNASGTGVFTIASPNSDTDYTINLPEISGGEFVVTDASGNVGIGTSSPSGLLKTLNIDGGAAGSSIALDGGSNFAVIYTGATAGDPTSLFSNTGFKFATATDKNATGFAEAMRINSSGNVGIGTTSPNERLVSSGTVRALGATTSNEPSTTISYTAGVGGVEVRGPDTSTRGTLNLYQAASNGSLGQTALHINSSGNVGIGAANPTTKLHIIDTNPVLTLQSNGASTVNAFSLIGRALDQSAQFNTIKQVSTAGGQFGTLAFCNGPSDTERMRIDASGNVTTPYQPIISGQIGTAAINPSGDQLIPFNEFWVSQGITYNSTTRRFTVPVDGFYRITMNPFKIAGDSPFRVMVGINTDAPVVTTHYGHTYTNDEDYATCMINSVVELNANDYIVFRLFQGQIYNQSADRFNQFSIELIG
jgi:hypothetical protein